MASEKKPVYCAACFLEYGATEEEIRAWHNDKLSFGFSHYSKPCNCCGKVGSVVVSKRIIKH